MPRPQRELTGKIDGLEDSVLDMPTSNREKKDAKTSLEI